MSEINESSINADVHFAVESLSDLKTAKSGVPYFLGQVTDGSAKLKIVGFDEKFQSTLSTLTESKTPVKVERCQIKRSRNDEYEIILNRSSNILPSPKKILFPEKTEKVHQVSSIAAINALEDGELINVTATVTAIAPVRPVSTGLVQETTIADKSATISMSVWGSNVDQLQIGETYEFQNFILVLTEVRKR
ncbi:MAG: hypothetical protein K0U52_11765 [Gammaproteobacteria bacterium]|nr:hypothetical protein [Gammaproteobacteria bacterium]